MPRANPAEGGTTAEDLSAPLNLTVPVEPAATLAHVPPGRATPSLTATRSQAARAAARATPSLAVTRSRSAPGGLEVADPPPSIVQMSSRVSMSESVVSGDGHDEDDEGCWAAARKRNFVLLRGIVVLVLHFSVGMIGYLPFKDDFVQQHNATEGVVDALYFSAGACPLTTALSLSAAELAEISGRLYPAFSYHDYRRLWRHRPCDTTGESFRHRLYLRQRWFYLFRAEPGSRLSAARSHGNHC